MSRKVSDDSLVEQWAQELKLGINQERNSRQIHQVFSPWVLGFLTKRGCSPEDSEDLAQEIFARLFEHISDFRGERPFRSWLFAIAANQWRKHRDFQNRKVRQAPAVSIDQWMEKLQWEPVAEEDSAEDLLISEEREADLVVTIEQLRQGISLLPTQQRQCLELFLAQDRKPKEIATLLRITPSTVRVHLHHAKKNLRSYLLERG